MIKSVYGYKWTVVTKGLPLCWSIYLLFCFLAMLLSGSLLALGLSFEMAVILIELKHLLGLLGT